MDIRLREATHFPGPRSCGCGDFVRGHALAIVGRRTQSPQQRGQASTPHKTGPFWWVFLGTLSEFMLGLRTPRSPRTPPWRGARVSGTSTFQNHHLGREGPHTSLLAGAHQCCSTLFPITPLPVPPPRPTWLLQSLPPLTGRLREGLGGEVTELNVSSTTTRALKSDVEL